MTKTSKPSDAEFRKEFADCVRIAHDLTHTVAHEAEHIYANMLAYFRTRGVPPEIMQIALDQAKREASPTLAAEAPTIYQPQPTATGGQWFAGKWAGTSTLTGKTTPFFDPLFSES